MNVSVITEEEFSKIKIPNRMLCDLGWTTQTNLVCIPGEKIIQVYEQKASEMQFQRMEFERDCFFIKIPKINCEYVQVAIFNDILVIMKK